MHVFAQIISLLFILILIIIIIIFFGGWYYQPFPWARLLWWYYPPPSPPPIPFPIPSPHFFSPSPPPTPSPIPSPHPRGFTPMLARNQPFTFSCSYCVTICVAALWNWKLRNSGNAIRLFDDICVRWRHPDITYLRIIIIIICGLI